MIGEMTFDKMKELICASIDSYKEEIKKGYAIAEKSFSLGMKVKIEPIDNGNDVSVKISFVKDKVNDEFSDFVEEGNENEDKD